MMPLILIIEPSNEEESFFSMAEEHAAGEFSNSDQGSDNASTTTPDAHLSHDSFHAEELFPRVPKSALLVVSWAVCAIGLYLFCVAGIGYYANNDTEVKLAIPVLLGILAYPVGMSLRRAAHHVCRDAFSNMVEFRWGWG